MANNPFQPPVFSTTIPSTKPGGGWSPYSGPQEDGPSIYANAGAVIYNGQNQTSVINAARPWASIPWEDGPNAVGPGGVIVPVAGQNPRAPLGTQGSGAIPAVAIQRWLSSADFLGADGAVYIYDRVTGAAYKET